MPTPPPIAPPLPASWKLRYRIDFKDYFGAAWEVLFYYQSTPPPGPISLLPAKSPLIFSKGKDTDDKYEPLFSSSAQINIVIDLDTLDSIKSFMFVEANTCKIIVNCDSGYTWEGWLVAEYCQYIYKESYYEFTINAVDGISINDKFSFDLYSQYNGDSDTSIINIFELLLFHTYGLLGREKVDESYQFNILLSYLFDDTSYFETVMQLNLGYFYDRSGATDKVKDFLITLMNTIGARFFYEDNQLWIMGIADMADDATAYRHWYFEDSNWHKEDLDLTRTKTIGGDSGDKFINDFASILLLGRSQGQEIDLALAYANLLKNSEWRSIDAVSGTPSDWDVTADSSYYTRIGTGTIDDPYKMKVQGGSGNVIISQTVYIPYDPAYTPQTLIISFEIDMTDIDATTWQLIAHEEQGTSPSYDYYETRYYDGSGWHDSAAFNDLDSNGDKIQKIEVEVNAPDPFTYTHGSTTDTIHFEHFILSFASSNKSGQSFVINDVSVGYKYPRENYSQTNYTEKQNYDNITESVVYENNISKEPESKSDSFIDDNSYFIQSLINPSRDLLKVWTSVDQPDAIAKNQRVDILALRSRANNNSFVTEKMNCTILSNTIKFYNVLVRDNDSKRFIICKDEYSVKESTHNLVCLEVKSQEYDDDSYVTTVLYDKK